MHRLRRASQRRRTRSKYRKQRVLRKEMFNVREQQLLMLLLVMEPERRKRGDSFLVLLARDELEHVPIDMLAIREDLLDRRSRQHAACGAAMHRPHGLVVRIEQILVLRVKRA